MRATSQSRTRRRRRRREREGRGVVGRRGRIWRMW
jgi:hypothetical protein